MLSNVDVMSHMLPLSTMSSLFPAIVDNVMIAANYFVGFNGVHNCAARKPEFMLPLPSVYQIYFLWQDF